MFEQRRCALREISFRFSGPTRLALLFSCLLASGASDAAAQSAGVPSVVALSDAKEVAPHDLQTLKTWAAARSRLLKLEDQTLTSETPPEPRIEEFRQEIAPVLKKACADCHGADDEEGRFRIDKLDPDLFSGPDVAWWLEILDLISNGEMPPEDGEPLEDEQRSKIVDWLSTELQLASQVRRDAAGQSAFRRMTRYEFNYALQDLLGLPYDFADDLPPDPINEEGFHNDASSLQMSATQFELFRELARKALLKAASFGPKPEPVFWSISMSKGVEQSKAKYEADVAKAEKKHADDAEALSKALEKLKGKYSSPHRGPHYRNLQTGFTDRIGWSYGGAKHAWATTDKLPEETPASDVVSILPIQQKWIVELGNRVPDRGDLKIRILASRDEDESPGNPSLRLEFGFQASNNSSASAFVSPSDLVIEAPAGHPKFYEWRIPTSEIPIRNPMRRTAQMGKTPSPSEYLKLHNSSISSGAARIYYIEVSVDYETWPTPSHRKLFPPLAAKDEASFARQHLNRFIRATWRRPATELELKQKLALFEKLRPLSDSAEEALLEVYATILSSPKFLYLSAGKTESQKDATAIATRLATFLHCSLPDEQLIGLAESGKLLQPQVLEQETRRLLADTRSRRFAEQFTRQWLGMELLDYLEIDRKNFPHWDPFLKEAMQEEPIAFLQEVLKQNASVLDFLHADYAMINDRLSRHYGIPDVHGSHFRRMEMPERLQRGGLLTQAGLLAMNSDGVDSHPLKRGIWLLSRLLDDPPPPPPPSVPEIDLADPEIAKMTLKERLEDHRNDPACYSCHAKIDPWGVAFENYDALGSWRSKIKGAEVDASSKLFNGEPLEGMQGLKRYLLEQRQDQFVRAMVSKLATFALGRPLRFEDRAEIDSIAAELRRKGDGLQDAILLLVQSDLFRD